MSEETKAVEIRKTNGALVPLIPEDAEGVFKISKYLAQSDLCPKSFANRPENVFAAIMYGRELGLGAMQAMSNIAVVNGRASVWGELQTALIRNSGKCAKLEKKFEGVGAHLKVILTGRRTGDTTDTVEEYSWADAEAAGNTSKDTYKKYPKDMLYYKALRRLGNFLWPDVLKGIDIREIADEFEVEKVGAVEVIAEPAIPAPAEPSKEELEKKASEAKAKFNAKAEAKAAKAKEPKATPAADALKDVPPATPAEEAGLDEPKAELEKDEPVEEAVPVNRIFGTLVQPVKLMGDDDKTTYYALKMETQNGVEKYLVNTLEEAKAAKEFQGKTVEMMWEKLEKPLAGIAGRVINYKAVAK